MKKEFTTLLWLWSYCAGVIVLRELATMWRGANFQWDGWMLREWPFPPPSVFGGCSIPERGLGGRPVKFCFSTSKIQQKREAARLDAIIEEMMAMGNIAAPQIGFPLKLILFRKQAMLNPQRTHGDGGQTWCTIVGVPHKIYHDRHLRVEYETPAGVHRSMDVFGQEACEMAFLLREIS